MRKTKVFFAIYDHKTAKNQIVCRNADIKDDGTAIIHLNPVDRKGFLERSVGDWIEAENFNVFWRKPLEEKAQAIAEKLLKEREKSEEI